jgi:hypothetical protein
LNEPERLLVLGLDLLPLGALYVGLEPSLFRAFGAVAAGALVEGAVPKLPLRSVVDGVGFAAGGGVETLPPGLTGAV